MSDDIFVGIVAIGDACIVVGVGFTIYHLYLKHMVAEGPPAPLPYLAAVLLAATFMLQRLAATGVYNLESLYKIGNQISMVLFGWTAVIVGLVIAAFLFKLSSEFSRVWVVAWYAGTGTGLVGSRFFVQWLLRRWGQESRYFRRIVVVGTGPLAARFIESTWSDPSLCVIGVFDDRAPSRIPAAIHGIRVLGNVSDLCSFVRQSRADMVLVALPHSADERIIEIAAKLKYLSVDIWLLSDAIGFRLPRRPVSYLSGVPVISIAVRAISGWPLLAKRALDTMLATTALVVLSPLLAAIAVLIKLDSPGPILFRQQRLGFNDNCFEICKFRTMRDDAADIYADRLVTRNDVRVTRIGRILRRLSLDELPQLWNVLAGEMSLVGPRPHALRARAGDKLYQEIVAEYAARHRVKPGITGWAQVNGWRGETDTIDKLRKRVEHDLYYIEHWSIAFDVWILVMTMVKAFGSRNAF
jgi:Undecaprenyl-phosphate glucose phosphotransferase